jgi:excisionase family DNA binding protein
MKLPGLDNAIKELEKIVLRATNLTVGKGPTKIRIGGDTLLAIKQVISALSVARDSILIEGQSDIELTSQEVADLLNVSRPYVVKLAREGELPHKMVGNRHRFLLSAVQDYERRRRVERDEALAAIVPEAGYTAEDF